MDADRRRFGLYHQPPMNADKRKLGLCHQPPMDADTRRFELDNITRKVIGCAYTVSNNLGSGFLEKVYENALAIELRKAGLDVEQQKHISVSYDGAIVGDFNADILVNDRVIVEVKAMDAIDGFHQAQLLNYLRVAGLKVGLILNFGTARLGIKRMVV